ncbi:MAG: hypothetical protein DRO06_04310 [Thermoproteota archaeon]|nr:MAG: hypothetical protein DRO06_04310 [Candidatus Korarchaeota archaeon]
MEVGWSRLVAAAAMCAALYAVGSFSTAYIVSPFGRGQFRPAVVIPAAFALVFGPTAAAVGAALGTLIADSVKHGTLYIPSLVAAVPGNFVGFYLFGKMLEGDFTWDRYVVASQLSLAVGCSMVAFLYVPTVWALGALPPDLSPAELLLLAVGLTVWFFSTEYPFMLILGPPIVSALSAVSPRLRERALDGGPSWLRAMVAPGLVLVALALALFSGASQPVVEALAVKLSKEYASATMALMRLMFLGTGLGMTAVGLLLWRRGG